MGVSIIVKIEVKYIEVKACVTVRGNAGVDWIDVTLTEDDLIEFCKIKALEKFGAESYDVAELDAIDSVKLEQD